jgi:hypothetical protein
MDVCAAGAPLLGGREGEMVQQFRHTQAPRHKLVYTGYWNGVTSFSGSHKFYFRALEYPFDPAKEPA